MKPISVLLAMLLSLVAKHSTFAAAYDPTIGRWLTRDPLPKAERLQGPNLYGYVSNRVFNFNDPLGLDAWSIGPVTIPWNYGSYIPGQWEHESEHRRQFWDGRRFTEPNWKLEQEAFKVQRDILKNQIDDVKKRGGCPSGELQSAYDDAAWAATEEGAKNYQEQVDKINPVRSLINFINRNFYDNSDITSD